MSVVRLHGKPFTHYGSCRTLLSCPLCNTTAFNSCHHAWFYVVLEIKARVLSILGQHSANWGSYSTSFAGTSDSRMLTTFIKFGHNLPSSVYYLSHCWDKYLAKQVSGKEGGRHRGREGVLLCLSSETQTTKSEKVGWSHGILSQEVEKALTLVLTSLPPFIQYGIPVFRLGTACI